MKTAFVKHYHALRNHPLYKDATIYYVLENNLGREHDHLNFMIQDTGFTNCAVLYEDENMIGFWTDATKKIVMDEALRDKVMFGLLSIANDFLTTNSDPNRQAETVVEMMLDQIEDLKDYTVMKNGVERRIITSILGPDLAVEVGKHDDLQRALSMLIYASTKFLSGKLPVDYHMISRLRENRALNIGLRNPSINPHTYRPIHTYDNLDNVFSRKRSDYDRRAEEDRGYDDDGYGDPRAGASDNHFKKMKINVK